jgi:hypothetical protein
MKQLARQRSLYMSSAWHLAKKWVAGKKFTYWRIPFWDLHTDNRIPDAIVVAHEEDSSNIVNPALVIAYTYITKGGRVFICTQQDIIIVGNFPKFIHDYERAKVFGKVLSPWT